jgi:hypothetical protein
MLQRRQEPFIDKMLFLLICWLLLPVRPTAVFQLQLRQTCNIQYLWYTQSLQLPAAHQLLLPRTEQNYMCPLPAVPL